MGSSSLDSFRVLDTSSSFSGYNPSLTGGVTPPLKLAGLGEQEGYHIINIIITSSLAMTAPDTHTLQEHTTKTHPCAVCGYSLK